MSAVQEDRRTPKVEAHATVKAKGSLSLQRFANRLSRVEGPRARQGAWRSSAQSGVGST
jgi:hypothetical protein